MLDAAGALARETAFQRLCKPGGPDKAGVTVRERGSLRLATLVARNDVGALTTALKDKFGLALPASCKRADTDDLAIMGIGPRAWLMTGPSESTAAERLQRELGSLAAVTDQSSGYGVLRISGPCARATFEKGLSIDLDPRAFKPADVAVTSCAHIGVTLWQLDEAPTYEVALSRSLAGSFWHWLTESAAEYGLHIEGDECPG
jgi:heterotetrameric sarcosine oxidase gamma subunit